MSDSPGLVDFAIGLVDSASNLPDRQVKFFEEFKLQKNSEINLLIKTFLGLVEMMFGLVNVSFSLPEWQAVKIFLCTLPSLIFLFHSTPLESLFTGWLNTYVLSFYYFIKEERKFDLLKSQKTILSSRWELNSWPGCSINHWATGAIWWAVSDPLMSIFWCILYAFVVS